MKEITLEFSKIVGEGKALGRFNGKIVFSYGVLPGETAKVAVKKEKKNFIEAELIEIIKESPMRVKPEENHYLSCSPWQIMNYELQIKTKKNLIEDFLYQMTKENIKLDNFVKAQEIFGYRTKIEYSFVELEGKLYFAFHKRGDYSQKIILDNGCKLIGDKANEIAFKILEKLNAEKLSSKQLKTLIIRKAINSEDIIASLYIKEKSINLSFKEMKDLSGFILIYSNPITSISTADEIIKVEGNDYISEKIGDMNFHYGFDCFFQNNIHLFSKLLEDIKSLNNLGRTLDLYSGVGVIGFYLKDKIEKLTSVEFSPNSSKYAERNMRLNSIKSEIICSASEKTEKEIFKNIDTVIVDPPRAGLHKNVIKNIMENLPENIIYISCNPITQGRDTAFFLEKYKIIKAIGYDFYPNTPHIENLLIFKRK
jgi:23S rRNA (uracil1939-C5)-methyltransferase